jgi:biopolymer transport protein ExbD
MRFSRNAVEVDMVPMIDIISLLLMFLIIVGDTAATASSVRMQLPRDMDQALNEVKLAEIVRSEGRIVIELAGSNGNYKAVMNGRSYELVDDGANGTLIQHLEKQINIALSTNHATQDKSGAIDTPVRLRIPEDAEMKTVEKLIITLARVGLVNVQYAADGKK